jgi:hypothetical protein
MNSFSSKLESKLWDLLGNAEKSDLYLRVTDPNATPEFVSTVVRYVLLEVFSYGPHVTEATFTAIGRMPKTRPDLMKPMILHDLDEVDQGEMALKDFVKLGGDESWARTRRMTPASFAMAATVRFLAATESPFAYLGYMYLFESLTPILTERLKRILAVKQFPRTAQKFLDFHAEEDVAHAKALQAFIERVLRDYPEAAAPIEYGFDCFAAVYPLPIWSAVLQHVQADSQQTTSQ